MSADKIGRTDALIHFFALGEGQYNLAKLTCAATDSLYRQSAYSIENLTNKNKATSSVQKTNRVLTHSRA